MPTERPARRMTLRQLLSHTEKSGRELIEHFQSELLPLAADFRELSRPVRRRSHYPTLMALQNALRKLQEAGKEIHKRGESLLEEMQEIHQHARQERVNRL